MGWFRGPGEALLLPGPEAGLCGERGTEGETEGGLLIATLSPAQLAPCSAAATAAGGRVGSRGLSVCLRWCVCMCARTRVCLCLRSMLRLRVRSWLVQSCTFGKLGEKGDISG